MPLLTPRQADIIALARDTGRLDVDSLIRQFKVDYAIIGTSAIGEDGTLLDYDYREVKVARKIVESSRRAILVADSMKYGRSAPVRIGHISEMNHFVTDAAPPPVCVGSARTTVCGA